MPLIEIENVSKRYGSVRALENVSLRMEGSGIMGLRGQNGAGKTTLINILTGYLAPTSGRALLGGHDPLMEPGEAKRHLGYLPEQPPLYDEMTVREYLRFVAALKGVAARAIPAHVDEVMELTGLTSMQSRLLGHLSKGFRQRAGMAQALCGDPDFLVLDEPTNGLDPQGIVEMRELILQLNRERQITVLISSHILDELAKLATHYGFLDGGRLVRQVTAQEVEAACRKCLRATVTDAHALCFVLDQLGLPYEVAGDSQVDIYEQVNVTQLVEALQKEGCQLLSLKERDESLESYYINLVGGERDA